MCNQQTENRKAEPYYKITLEEYASASFCSFTKEYLGTSQMFSSFAAALRQDRKNSERLVGLADRILESCQPDGTFTGSACEEQPSLVPVEVVHSDAWEEKSFYFKHINVWGCSYEMRAEKVVVNRIYYRSGDTYGRAIGASLYRPTYSAEPLVSNEKVDGNFWGHPGILYLENDWLSYRLMYEERVFDDESQLMADIAAPAEVDYRGFFNDVFGDG